MPTDRFTWAAKLLDVKPSDRILEIGCGQGLAVPLVARQLARGKLLAIDRSSKMTAVAAKRNQELVERGKVAFETAALEALAEGGRRFSKIFAVNVNLFWTDPAAGIVAVARLLSPGGRLYLFYQPPSATQIGRIAATLPAALEHAGFARVRVQTEGARMLCVRASAPAARRR